MWSQGSWFLKIFCSKDLEEADVLLEFRRPIIEKIQSIFGSVLVADRQSVSTGLLSVKPKTPGSVSVKARLNVSEDPTKTSATKGFLVKGPGQKTDKTDSRSSFHALSTSQDQSSLPCAQPSVPKSSSSIPQKIVNKAKQLSRMSLTTGPLKLLKRPKSKVSIKSKSPKSPPKKSPKPVENKPKVSPKKRPGHSEKTPSRIESNSSPVPNKREESVGVVKAKDTAPRVSMKRNSKSAAHLKMADIQAMESKGSDVSLNAGCIKVGNEALNVGAEEENVQKAVDVPILTITPVAVAAPTTENFSPETNLDGRKVDAKKSRLSYSGRRIRAQRKALKRKSENPEIPVVRKKICFENVDGEKAGKVQDEVNCLKTIPQKAAKNLLSDWEEIYDGEDPNMELSESLCIPDMKVKEQDDVKGDEVPSANPSTSDGNIKKLSIETTETPALAILSPQDDLKSILDIRSSPPPRENIDKDNEGGKAKGKSILIKDSANKKRRSSKVLFSSGNLILDSEVDQADTRDNNGLKPDMIPNYDQSHKKDGSEANVKSRAGQQTPFKPIPADSSLALNTTNKFFKEKFKESSTICPNPTSSKPKRTYQRRPSSVKSVAKKSPGDLYSLSDSPPKLKGRCSYLQKKRKSAAGSKRRSEKLFSDDEREDSIKPSPEKTFADHTLRISDVGDAGNAVYALCYFFLNFLREFPKIRNFLNAF